MSPFGESRRSATWGRPTAASLKRSGAPATKLRSAVQMLARLRRRHIQGPQLSLPPTDIVPGAPLEPHVAIDAERLEPDSLVQAHAPCVRQRNAGERLVVAQFSQAHQQRLVQPSTN